MGHRYDSAFLAHRKIQQAFRVVVETLATIGGLFTRDREWERIVAKKRQISTAEAKQVGATLGVDWKKVDPEQFRRGLEVELEHGARDPETNVTNDDLTLTGKIAWAHLKEFPDYYTRLDKLEAEADAYWSSRG